MHNPKIKEIEHLFMELCLYIIKIKPYFPGK